MNDITELPHDIFMLILWYLSPRTCVLCRRVSRHWFITFTEDNLCKLLLRWNFPRCREVRFHAAAATLAGVAGVPHNLRVELEALAAAQEQDPYSRPWATAFATVARRYHHMRTARPRVVEKISMAGAPFSFRGVQIWNRFLRLDDREAKFHYPDPYWSYSQADGLLAYPDNAAAVTGEDGQVYKVLDLATGENVTVPFDVRGKYVRRVRLAQGVLIFEWAEAKPYHQLNIQEVVHRHFVTAFDVVRSLSVSVETRPDGRAYSTAQACGWTWDVKFRSEWKLHFLGLPINRSDRFFSAHSATHYAVYFWQPNRSLYQDDPIEQLAVWDISSPSPYRPSEDPTGDVRPHTESPPPGPTGLWRGLNGGHPDTGSSGNTTPARQGSPARKQKTDESLSSAIAGPQVIRRMAWRELDYYGIRQRANPQLRNLALDDRNLYFIEEEHRWAEGQHSSLNPPRVHLVRCTGIPVIPPRSVFPSSSVPRVPASLLAELRAGNANTHAFLKQLWQDGKVTRVIDINEIAAVAEAVVAKAAMNRTRAAAGALAADASGAEAADSVEAGSSITALVDGPVFGPIWVDTCGAEGDVNMNFCQRVALPRIQPSVHTHGHDNNHGLSRSPALGAQGSVDHAHDQLLHAWTNEGLASPVPPAYPTPAMALWPWGVNDVDRGIISGRRIPDVFLPSLLPQPARWPGWAPCWRHEDFPYLTITEMVDLAAGVRIAARHCFMLETLSVHVRPKIWFKGPGEAQSRARTARSSRGGELLRDVFDVGPEEESEAGDDGSGMGETIEAQFPDEMWADLLAKGHVAGDERWVVGEDHSGCITIVRF